MAEAAKLLIVPVAPVRWTGNEQKANTERHGGERVTLQVELVSAESRVWSGSASMIIARTVEGEIGIMTGHEPTLALLAPGRVQIRVEGGESIVAEVEDGGFLSIDHDRVTVVADTAALVSASDR
jgi:F-type H+-transporting ATPase subunit epsilon